MVVSVAGVTALPGFYGFQLAAQRGLLGSSSAEHCGERSLRGVGFLNGAARFVCDAIGFLIALELKAGSLVFQTADGRSGCNVAASGTKSAPETVTATFGRAEGVEPALFLVDARLIFSLVTRKSGGLASESIEV